MKRKALAALAAAAALAGDDTAHVGALPGGRRHGLRKATVRPWNAKEKARRARQIERGILKTTRREWS